MVETADIDERPDVPTGCRGSSASQPLGQWPADGSRPSVVKTLFRKEKGSFSCHFCPKSYPEKTSNVTLKKHIEKKHQTLHARILVHHGYENVLRACEKEVRNVVHTSQSMEKAAKARTISPNTFVLKALYALHLIVYGFPFNSLTSPLLALYSRSSNACFPTRDSMTMHLRFFAEISRRANIALFSALPSVSSASDTWTSISSIRMIVLCLRGLRDDFTSVTRTVWMGPMQGEHVAVREARMLRSIVDEFTSPHTLHVSQVSDGDPKARLCARLLVGEGNTVWCFAHLLHLAITDFLTTFQVDSICASRAIEKVRNIVKLIHSSPMLDEIMQEKRRADGKSELSVVLDVCNRWNSTFSMLERFFEQREYIDAMIGKDIVFVDLSNQLTTGDLTVLENVMMALRVAEKLSRHVSGTDYPTLSCVPEWVEQLRRTLGTGGLAATGLLKCVNSRFERQLGFDLDDDGFEWACLPYRCACFDPRHASLEFLRDAEERDKVWASVVREAESQLPQTVLRRLVGATVDQLRLLLENNDYDNPAVFWTSDASEPVALLRPVARAMLSVPASSVDPERAFSSAGYIEDELRASMDPITLCQSVIVRDWFRSTFLTKVPTCRGRGTKLFMTKESEDLLIATIMKAQPTHLPEIVE
jgi:hypothetical protein